MKSISALKLTFVYLALIFFNLASIAHAGERTLDVDVASKGPEARQEAFQKAVQVVSQEMAEKRIGSPFLNEHKKRFETEVLSKSDKYILSVKGAGSKPTENGTRITVVLNISEDAFESVLRQSGLVQLSRQSLTAVIFLDEKDKASKEGPWWAQVQMPETPKSVQTLKAKLNQDLKRRGIEVIDQRKVFSEIPAELKKANLNREELIQMGKKHNASLVFLGLIAPKGKDGFIYHGQWVQVPAERMLNEIQGEAKNIAETSEKFMEPVLKAQALGTLNTRPFTLRIRGDMNPTQLKAFREELSSKVREIRSLEERLLARGDFSFEAESPQSPETLIKTIQALSFKDFQLRASLDGEDQILLSVKRR